MRIAVLGTGANGASIAADLTRAGGDVTLIEQWPAHVEAMRADGVRVEMPDGSETTPVHVLHLCEVAEVRGRFDLVFLLVKGYDTRWAAELIKPVLAEDGAVVALQNGMTVDAVADAVGAGRTVGGVIEVASTLFVPGVVRRDTTRAKSWFAVGAHDAPAGPREERIAEILRAAGRVEVVDDIRSAKWMKLVANATELVPSAILDMTVMDAVTVPGFRDVMVEAGREAVLTGLLAGRQMVPILGLSPRELQDPTRIPEALLEVVHDQFSIPGQLTTVLQDWVKGRRAEIDELNGTVVRTAASMGVRTPVNEAIVRIAHRIESGDLARGAGNADLLIAALADSRAIC